MSAHQERNPDEILSDIDQTRASIDSTLQAIEQKLTPGELIDQGLDYLRHSGGREFVGNLGDSVKNNPMPVALVGIGLAWLMASGRRSAQPQLQTGTGLAERAGDTMDRAAEAAGSARDRLSDTAQAARERASRTAQSARERAGRMGDAAREQAARISDTARHQIDRARNGYDTMLREQPLALGAIGLAIGAVIAAAAPRTKKENELLGPARDRLAERAKDLGREQIDQAKHVARAATDAAKDELERASAETSTGASPEDGTGQSYTRPYTQATS